MVKPKDCFRILLSEIEDNPAIISAAQISVDKSQCIGSITAATYVQTDQTIEDVLCQDIEYWEIF